MIFKVMKKTNKQTKPEKEWKSLPFLQGGRQMPIK